MAKKRASTITRHDDGTISGFLPWDHVLPPHHALAPGAIIRIPDTALGVADAEGVTFDHTPITDATVAAKKS